MSIDPSCALEVISETVNKLSDLVAALEARLPKPKERYVIRVGHDHLWISGNIFKVSTRDDADALVRILIRSGFEDANFWVEVDKDG